MTGSDGSIRIDTRIEDNNVTRELRALQREMKAVASEMKIAQLKATMPFRRELAQTEMNMLKLATSMGKYSGTNQQFMGEVDALGKAYKKTQDNMINADRTIAQSMIQTAGQMSNMSTQASKISGTYERMGNPMYKVNSAGLAVADSLNKIANNGNAASIALKQLGPNASMKQLYDLQGQINQGLMRFQMVAMGAALTSVVVYGAMHKAAMDANEGYKKSFEGMMAALKKAMEPLIEVFAMVMIPIFNMITAVAQWVSAFSEAHPVIAQIVAGILLLIPALTLLLSPLAIGIGLIAGMQAAFASVWMLIGPLVTGLAAMSATVWIVAAAIVALTAGFIYLWNNHEGFRQAIITGWEAIKAAVQTAIDFIMPYITQAFEAIKTFVKTKLDEIKAFWDENGQQILQALQNAWSMITSVIQTAMSVITPILQVAWEVIKMLVISTWEAIKNVIDGALNVIKGIIKVFTGLFTADWKMLWEGIKQILSGAVQLIWGLINLYFVSKLLGPLKTFGTQAKSLLQTAWAAIKTMFTSTLNAIKSLFVTIWNAIKSNLDKVTNASKTSITTAWNAIKSFFSNILGSINSIVSNAWNTMKSAITSKMGEIKTQIQSIWKQVEGFFKNINLFNIGKDIISGLINGIGSMADAVWDKAKSIADGIGNTIKSALKIHSPSRLTTDLGEFTGIGMEVGLDNTVKRVTSAANRLAQAAVPVITTKPFGGLSNVDNSKTYTGGETNIYVQGNNLSPSEITKRNQQMQRQQALEWGFT